MEPVRLNKYLSEQGICSRREADRMAEEGRITVNGVKAEPGTRVADGDRIEIDGQEMTRADQDKVIIAVNKPVGVVCTTRAFPGEENIVDLVHYGSRLYPVGRLDKDSQGLIFLTNDGAFAAEVTKASGHHEKEYEVTVNKDLTDNFLRRISKGVYLRDLEKSTAECEVRKTGERSFSIVLTQGMNRQIRRMCEACGYEVRTLKRVRIMNVVIGDLKEGTWREVSGPELRELLKRVKGDSDRAKARAKARAEKEAAEAARAPEGAEKRRPADVLAEDGGRKRPRKPVGGDPGKSSHGTRQGNSTTRTESGSRRSTKSFEGGSRRNAKNSEGESRKSAKGAEYGSRRSTKSSEGGSRRNTRSFESEESWSTARPDSRGSKRTGTDSRRSSGTDSRGSKRTGTDSRGGGRRS